MKENQLGREGSSAINQFLQFSEPNPASQGEQKEEQKVDVAKKYGIGERGNTSNGMNQKNTTENEAWQQAVRDDLQEE